MKNPFVSLFLKHKQKKNKSNQNTPLNPYLAQLYSDAKSTAKINGLSPEQIKAVISRNADPDFLADEIKNERNNPDIQYLTFVLYPTLTKEPHRNDVTPEDMLKAVSVGDLLGSVWEFSEHDYESTRTVSLPLPNSRTTDDTILTAATLSAIKINPSNPDFRAEYIRAYMDNPDADYGSGFSRWARGEVDNAVGYHSKGNGCAMRIACIPAFYSTLDEIIRQTVTSVMVTHNHVESVKASIVLAVCQWMALNGYSKEDIKKYAEKYYTFAPADKDKLYDKNIVFDLNCSLSDIKNDISQKSLFASYAVPFAIKCFLETDNFEGCMREVLSHFGDTDTICAIAAGLCCAYYKNIEN